MQGRATDRIAKISVRLPDSIMDVSSFVVRGDNHVAVIDSLMRPADIGAVSQASFIIYTHADWDHCWGSSHLPHALVVAHHSAYARLASDDARLQLSRRIAMAPDFFVNSSISLPQITFSDQMTIDLGGLSLRLSHLPGHTRDSIVVHIPEIHTLVVGDAWEAPVPWINEPGYSRQWSSGLRQLALTGVKRVLSSHSEEASVDDLLQTADYIDKLHHDISGLLSQGYTEEEIQQELPLFRYLKQDLDQTFQALHGSNLAAITTEILSAR